MIGLTERVPIPDDLQRRLDLWKWAGASLWCAVVGWFALVRAQRVPILWLADVGIHELGHAITWQLTRSELAMLVMGSGTQVLFPLLAGLAFFVLQRNRIALAICLAWGAAALADTATYVFDAPRGELTLIGFGSIGDQDQALGDWARILGPEHLDRLHLADLWAADLRHLALVTWLVAVAVAVAGLVLTWRRVRRDRRPRIAASLPEPSAEATAFIFSDRPR